MPAILATQNARLGSPLAPEDLSDVVQDVLTLVWRKLDDFEGRAALETWVYRFCFLELMNGVRRARRRPDGAGGPPPEASEVRESRAATPEPLAEEFEALHRGLERLGPPWADVLRLKHFLELTFEEIGERLGVPANTAKTQYYRGLAKLRSVLGDEEPDR